MAGGAGGKTRVLGNLLIAVGVVALLLIAGCYGQQRIQEEQLRSQLRASPSPSSVVGEPAATKTPNAPATSPLTSTSLPGVPIVTPSDTVATATAPVMPAAIPETTALPLPAGPPVRIVFPDLKIDAPVVEMGWQVVQTAQGPQSEWNTPEDAAGHHINSADLGEGGNVVLSAHNNIYGEVFGPISWAWDDDDIEKLDSATDRSHILDGHVVQLFSADGQEFDYAVTAFYRLRDTGVATSQRIENARFMQPTSDSQLTLITCWPPSSNTHRLVVVAQPVSR